jgi:hypothetical protein
MPRGVSHTHRGSTSGREREHRGVVIVSVTDHVAFDGSGIHPFGRVPGPRSLSSMLVSVLLARSLKGHPSKGYW